MTRMTFGNNPSPLLSIATVQKHEKDHERDHPTAAKEVSENMYVDDVLTGAPKDKSAVNLRDELCNLLSKGGFQLTKWASNSGQIMETTPLRDIASTLVPTSEPEKMSDSLKVLGTSWNTKDDVLMFTNASSILTEKDPKTKRSLISLYSSLRSHGFADSLSRDSKVAVSRIVGSRSRLGSATRLGHRELLGYLETRTSKHLPNQSSKVVTSKSIFR